MDACQVYLDIVSCITHFNYLIVYFLFLPHIYVFYNQTVNYELTRAYLDLVTTYVALMILLSRVEDRKAVLGLFNAAHEMVHNQR